MRAGFGFFRTHQGARASSKTNRLGSLSIFAGLVLTGAALAAIPQPQPRPPEFGKPAPVETPPDQPPSAPQNAPTVPAAPQTPPSGRAPVDVDVNTLQPFNLPPASREKMHQCGDEWRKLKLDGKSRGLTWRSFAEKCLVR